MCFNIYDVSRILFRQGGYGMVIDYKKVLFKLTSKKEPLTREEEDKMIKLIEWYNKHLVSFNKLLNK